FVTIRTGLPDADAGRGSACMQPVSTTPIFGLVFDCPAAVAARHRHVMAESPIRLIMHLLSRRVRSTSGPADKLQSVRQSNLTSQVDRNSSSRKVRIITDERASLAA